MASTVTHMARRSHRDPVLSLVAASSPLWAILVTFLASLTGRICCYLDDQSTFTRRTRQLVPLLHCSANTLGRTVQPWKLPTSPFFFPGWALSAMVSASMVRCAVPRPCLLRRAHCCYQLMAWEQVIHGSTNKRQEIPLC